MAATDELKSLVDQMPAPDERGMYCHVVVKPAEGGGKPETIEIDKEKIETAIAEIAKGGKAAILGLVGMLVEPGKGDDVKAHYALHCLAVHVCKARDEKARVEFAEVLASQLGTDRPKGVQAYLAQELGVAGGKEAIAAMGKLLTDEELCEPAAMALAAIGEGAAEQFRAALPKAKGKCRLNIVQALGRLADAKAVEALKQAAGDEDREVRLAAAWALANLGDEADQGAVDAVLKAADVKDGWERIQAAKAAMLLAERLLAAGKRPQAARVYTHLRDTRTDPKENYIRQQAIKALAERK